MAVIISVISGFADAQHRKDTNSKTRLLLRFLFKRAVCTIFCELTDKIIRMFSKYSRASSIP